MPADPPLNNGHVAALFESIAALMQVRGDNPFKVRAYSRAAEAIRALPYDIRDAHHAGTLKQIAGIGDAIAAKIEELLETGRLGFLERLEAELPVGVGTLLQVPELGPKSVKAIYERLGISSLEALEAAARAGQLQQVSGIGAKSEQRILAGLEALRLRTARPLLGVVLPRAEALLAALRAQAGAAILHAELAGSLRRRQATVDDLKLLAAAAAGQQESLLALFEALPAVGEVVAREPERRVVRLHSGEQAELCVALPEQWGAALLHHTGSAAHWARLAAWASERGVSLRAEGLFRGSQPLAADSEQALYEALGLPWIAPELREGQGEVEAAAEGLLPELVEEGALCGDLHSHSRWSDGKASILEMAQAARARGYEYLVITDHSQSLAVANGLSVERLIEQRYEMINVNARFDDFAVLQGSEVEIRADGSLDFPDEVLAQLDVVVASMHSGTRGDRDSVTRRMLAAIRNPHVDVIGHMTNRLLGRRAEADLDMDAVLQAAAEHGTILEINAQVARLDLDPTHARRALEYGCLLSVNSDAHDPEGLATIGYGIAQARRAWAEADDIINTRSLEELLSYIQERGEAEE